MPERPAKKERTVPDDGFHLDLRPSESIVRKLWLGETHVRPQTVSANHHQGESETAINVRSGHPDFVFHDSKQEIRITTSPGDYIFTPPYLPHREENSHADEPAVVVIARTTQETIVVNLPELYAL